MIGNRLSRDSNPGHQLQHCTKRAGTRVRGQERGQGCREAHVNQPEAAGDPICVQVGPRGFQTRESENQTWLLLLGEDLLVHFGCAGSSLM